MGRKFAAMVFSLGCLQASSALALGLGELKLESFLNEPLKASVDLLNTDGMHEDEIRVRLGTREDFKRLGLDRTFFLTSIQMEVVVDDNGNARIVMTTDEPVLEPYLDFLVEARWPTGRMLREYTVLIDPPAFTDATPVVSASERVEVEEGIPAPGKKKELAASSGTRVDVTKSDLGPGEMPQRDFNAEAAGSPLPGGRYMVARDDTLWEIAQQARPDGTSVHQTMLDIQRLNPDAFINNNINRVKAGYIIYLPSADDISSADLESALAEVREQNDAWRAGRDAERAALSGPSLRIAADTEELGQESEGGDPVDSHVPGAAALEEADRAALASAEESERMAAMEQQLETLQRIVNLKDEQIAALQSALAENEQAPDAAAVEAAEEAALAEEMLRAEEAALEEADAGEAMAEEDIAGEETVEEIVEEAEEVVEAKPAPTAEKPSVAAPAETSGGIMDYLWYILGAVVLGLVGFFVMRRRGGEEEVHASAPAVSDDVFSGVELKDSEIAIEEETPVPAPPPVELEAAGDDDDDEAGQRGYGERKHDAYASDVEAADALAEADIYIAYGRHPQAIDLLNNALANEPGNPVYRLKLLEIYVELNNVSAAEAELEEIRSSGDADSIARAEELLAGLDAGDEQAEVDTVAPAADGGAGDTPGLAPNPLELTSEGGEELEAEFSGLEIEGGAAAQDGGEDLDLSADFEGDAGAGDDEELVIAADANGLSTKLDLARAYLDMGDDDGARQILDEIVAEGSDELKAEAQALLDRIG